MHHVLCQSITKNEQSHMNNNCISRNYSEMYIQSQTLTIIG